MIPTIQHSEKGKPGDNNMSRISFLAEAKWKRGMSGHRKFLGQ